MDCLGDRGRDDRALAFIEEVENERLTELYEELALYKRQAARNLADNEKRHASEAANEGTKRKRRNSVISISSEWSEDSQMSDDD